MSRLVLVTGGAGFIGSHLVDALLARGDRVRVLDDFSTGRRENLAHCLADIDLVEGDVREPGLVARAVAGCDGVLHEAAVASVTRSLEDPVGTGSVTHGGTVNVALLARRAGVGAFVLASSCAVYGDTDVLPIAEDAPPRPLSPYAVAKLLSECACRSAPQGPADGLSDVHRRSVAGGRRDGERDGMRAVALRYFNVYGPRQDPSSEYSGVIARFMDVAAMRKAWFEEGERTDVDEPLYVVFGDGRQSRDFVFVSDVVAANLLALDACLSADAERRTEVDGATVNVGTGVSVDLLEIVSLAEALRGGDKPGGEKHDEAAGAWAEGCAAEEKVDGPAAGRADADEARGAPIDFRAPRAGDIRASLADIARARCLLGYEPATSFADGLAATYRWYADEGSAR